LLALASALVLMAAAAACAQSAGLPPAEGAAKARLDSSPRHGEWVTVDAGSGDKVDAFVVYPERPDRAPVVIVIHEIFGLSDWVRSVADQLAAEGFIAIAPDLISGKAPGGKGSRAVSADDARALVSELDPAEVTRRLNAVAAYATALPAALPRYGVIGFCWGGTASFAYATQQPGLAADVVFYGTAPSKDALARITAPVLGQFGGSDARVDTTIPPAAAEMKRLGKPFTYTMYPGAGHAFARAQDGMNGANLKAIQQAWPQTIQFLKTNLESGVSRGTTRQDDTHAVLTAFAMRCVCDSPEGAVDTTSGGPVALLH
ncbi:MAG TPA: dienelactone hydrolase family protein, partial [bacterium]|nr:dienelactone hydrolase family protein [bacterium]